MEGLYLADAAETTKAEWYRWLAENDIPPREALPRDLWRMELDVEVADLSSAARLASVDLPLPGPYRRAWAKFQDVGERLYRDGWAGLIAPSAARPAFFVVCLFWSGPVLNGVRPVPPPELWDDAPVPPRGMTT